jgi:small GTP-binding protein
MGQFVSAVWEPLLGKEATHIVIVGLGSAGKTTVLYNLKLGGVVGKTTVPAMGVESVGYRNIKVTVLNIGNQDRFRSWRQFYQGVDGVIFVVDSTDRERLVAAHDELNEMLGKEEMQEAVLLILANKQDLPHAMTGGEIMEKLGLHGIQAITRRWFLQTACATTGDGLHEGLDWLCRTLSCR